MAARRPSSPGGARAQKRGRGGRTSTAPASVSAGGNEADEAVAEIQRLRLLRGMATACRQLGAGRVNVTDAVAAAGVSRRTFYEVFNDREECLMAALAEALRRATERIVPAYRAHERRRQAVRAGVEELLAFIDEDRSFGTLLIVDSLSAGPRVLAWRAQVIDAVAKELEPDEGAPYQDAQLRQLVALGAVGGALGLLHTRLVADPDAPLSPLASELTAIVLLPHLGRAAAASEAARPARRRPRAAADRRDLLAASGVRLTYRTVHVLAVLAELQGAQRDARGLSNRQVAEAAGITDQGQISKLLARLARLGLIENRRSSAAGRGQANAWRLTAEGAQLERATRVGRAGAPKRVGAR
jgi:AcrR family transcriptional regulator